MANNECVGDSNEADGRVGEGEPCLTRCSETGEVQHCPQSARQIYLITYSQADLSLVPTREAFSALVLDWFKNAHPCSATTVLQWVCCREPHVNGGVHYHMSVKLESRRRWVRIRDYIQFKYSINVHFSGNHVNYYSASRYTTKSDE